MASDSLTAYQLLASYDERLKQNAIELPSTQDLVQYWSGISFTLDGVSYVVPRSEVAEVLAVPGYTRVPGVHGWMRGVSNVRGRLMAIMDLMVFLHKVSKLKEKKRRVLVIDDVDLYTGLVVDEILGMEHFTEDSFIAQWSPADEDVAPYVQGAFEKDGAYWPVFSLRLLSQDPRFLQVNRAG